MTFLAASLVIRLARRTAIVATFLTIAGGVSPAYSQAVSRSGEASLKLQAINGTRTTNPDFNTTFTPSWHAAADPETAVDDAQALTRNVAYSLSLSDRASVSEEAPAGGTFSFAVQSGTLPTGVTLQTDVACPVATVAFCLKGTPSTVQAVSATIRATYTPQVGSATTADQEFDFDVTDPDGTAPNVPTNISAVPTATSTELQVTWTASIDPSGILNYQVSRSGGETTCNNADNNVVTVTSPTVTHTYTGLTASTTYWVKVRARDNSVAQNVSAWSTCVSGMTAASGGTTLVFNDGLESPTTVPATDTDTTNPLYKKSSDGTGVLAISTTHAREGTKSLRAQLSKSGTTNFRQELRVKSSTDSIAMAGSGDYWLGFSVYVPSGSSLVSESTLAQWHTNGTACCSPVYGLRVLNGDWRITQEGTASNTNTTIGAVATNEWTDWVARVRWRKDTTGLIQVWQNGTLVLDRANDQTGATEDTNIPFFKWGRYSSSWKQAGNGDANATNHESWHDSLRICYGAACVYSDVAPQGNRLSAP